MKKSLPLLKSKTVGFKTWLLFTLFMPLLNCYSQTYCTPAYYDDCFYDDDINSFKLTGQGTSVLSDLNTGCTSGGYLNRSSTLTPVDLLPGQTYTAQLNTSSLTNTKNMPVFGLTLTITGLLKIQKE